VKFDALFVFVGDDENDAGNFEGVALEVLRSSLRERIVLPIAVVPGFPDWIPLIAVEIQGQAYAFEVAFLRKACRRTLLLLPEQFRPLRWYQGNTFHASHALDASHRLDPYNGVGSNFIARWVGMGRARANASASISIVAKEKCEAPKQCFLIELDN